jgi:ABC-type branched-subunit amino acid transport system substrate-binding protein
VSERSREPARQRRVRSTFPRVRAIGIVAIVVALQPAAAHAQSTVYSSLPLSGPSAPQTRSIVRGAQFALSEAGGMAGGQPVRYVSLNSATRRSGAWTPARTAANARRAALDDSTVAYIGEFNSGGSAISIPIMNEARIAQISPSNTAIGLTRGGPGTGRGEPKQYYPPSGQDFFRRYGARYDDPFPDPFAIYGYEAMRVVLDAVAAAGPDRRAVIRGLRTMPNRTGVLGTYRFDRFGDTTLRTYGLYRIRRGELVFAGAVTAP